MFNWQWNNIGSSNDLAPNRKQDITIVNDAKIDYVILDIT